MRNRVSKTAEFLEFHLAADFVQSVTAVLRTLTDAEINELYLMTHTGPNMGDTPHSWVAVLMPLVEAEVQLRRDLEVLPAVGPIIASELYGKGGRYDLPF